MHQTATLTLAITGEDGGTLPVIEQTYMGNPGSVTSIITTPLLKTNMNYTLEIRVTFVGQNASKVVLFGESLEDLTVEPLNRGHFGTSRFVSC